MREARRGGAHTFTHKFRRSLKIAHNCEGKRGGSILRGQTNKLHSRVGGDLKIAPRVS